MTKFLTGAQMYSVRTLTQSAESLYEALKAVKAMGYNAVQLSGQSADIPMERIADMLAELRLDCGATHQSFQELEENLDAVIRRHKLWKCDYPGVGSMPFRYGGSAEGIREFARKANAIAEKLLNNGLHFIYHTHAFEFARFGGVTGMDILMDEFSPAVQFELDVYWVQAGGGEPVEWVRKVGGRMDVVHFKEMAGRLPDEKDHSMTKMAPVGEGNLNWPAIMAACDGIGVKYAFVEQDNAVDSDPLGCMRTSHDNLVRLGARRCILWCTISPGIPRIPLFVHLSQKHTFLR